MKIFLTGGTGFIGSHLINSLHESGHSVFCLIRKDSSSQTHFKKQPKWVEGELGNGSFQNLPNCDLVIHLAASGVKSSWRDWNDCIKTNIVGTNELLNNIKKLKSPPTLIYPRTFYENHFEQILELSKNPYFATKFATTNIVKLWSENNPNIPVLFTTIFQVYGIGDDKKNVLSYTIDSINQRKTVNLGNPDILRDWIYIEDLIDAFMKLINQKNKITSFYDLGTGNLFTLKNMIDIINNCMKKKNPKLNYNHFKNTFDSKVDSSAKFFVPGWTQSFSNKKGIKQFINNSINSN